MNEDKQFTQDEVTEIVCSKLVADIEKNRTPTGFFEAMSWPNQALEASISTARHHLQPELKLECAPDCYACCKLLVIVTRPVYLVTSWIWFMGSGAAKAGVMDLERNEGCGFYINHACTIYPFRPTVCRIFHSKDRIACETGHPPNDVLVGISPLMATGVSNGVCKAMDQLGIDNRTIHLNPGLRILAGQPNMVTRWLAGEPIFAPAERKGP